MYTRDYIQQVHAHTDLVPLIHDSLEHGLTPAVDDWQGTCPFCQSPDTTLRVYVALQIFKCLACNAGGNAFTFLRQKNNWTFTQAVDHLSHRLAKKAI